MFPKESGHLRLDSNTSLASSKYSSKGNSPTEAPLKESRQMFTFEEFKRKSVSVDHQHNASVFAISIFPKTM